MSRTSPSPNALPLAPPPRPVTSGPIRACPRWDPPSGTVLEPGVELSGLTFGTNREIIHEVVLVDSSGNPVPGAVITPSTLTPSGGPTTFTGTVAVLVPAGTPGGNYYLQVRIPAPDTAANYSHTIELLVDTGPIPTTPLPVIVPAPGSEPGSYPVGTWIILDSAVTGGTPGYTYDWLLNGGSGAGTASNLSFQLNEGPVSVSLQVTDATSAMGTSAALDYVGVPAGAFQVTVFRRDPADASVPAGTTVAYIVAFSGGTPPYSCELRVDDSTTLPTVTTSSGGEVAIGSFTYGLAGSFPAVLTARDSAGATLSPSLPLDVT